jgi:hypothetical protein
MRPPSHLCPASRINTGYSLFPHNFGIPFCDFCVTSAPSASAPPSSRVTFAPARRITTKPRHSRVGGNPFRQPAQMWIPACAGMAAVRKAFNLRPAPIPTHQTPTTSPMRPPSHLCPASRINTGYSLFPHNFGIPFCDFCVTSAPSASAPAFLPPTFRTSFFTQHTHARFATTIISPCLPHLTVPPFGALSPPCFVALMARWRLPCLCSWP